MIITDKVSINGINPQKPDKPKAADTTAARTGESASATSAGDQVTLSDTAKKVVALQVEAMQLPDVRTGQVDQAKAAINSGTYNIAGDAVAGKMLKEALSLSK